jgi:hypothetical protein
MSRHAFADIDMGGIEQHFADRINPGTGLGADAS